MSEKHIILKGTFILTITGFLSRLIGFFYRMFLSHTFGEESVGLYQLIFPIYALCFSLTAAGIETAISRCVACRLSLAKPKEARQILYVGLSSSLFLSVITAFILLKNASAFSIYILGDIRCEPLLAAISYSLPFASIHSCICGYYLGQKQTKIPALAQLIEQLARVFSVYIIYLIAVQKRQPVSILFAVIGLVIGEIASSLFCIQYFTHGKSFSRIHFAFKRSITHFKELTKLSLPLTANRILLNILQSIEAISIPIRLQQYGYSSSDALSSYGVLTGMALPCILFPSAVTNSVSTMLLPTVTEIQTSKNWKHLKKLIQKVTFSCFSMGFACCLFFLLFGNRIGNFLFHSRLAGDFLLTLSWICPFLYMNSTLVSVINGLGNTTISFCINTLGLLIRIIGVIVFIPQIGINGYLWGLLASQLAVSILSVLYLKHHITKWELAN